MAGPLSCQAADYAANERYTRQLHSTELAPEEKQHWCIIPDSILCADLPEQFGKCRLIA